MNEQTQALCLLAHTLPAMGESQLTCLLKHYQSIEALWDANPSDWRECGIKPATLSAALQLKKRDFHKALAAAKARLASIPNLVVIDLHNPTYPPLLKEIYDPPPFLYVRGDLSVLAEPQLAMVGSRNASSAGLRAANEFAAQAVRAGFVVTSGLARGIDGEAHRSALNGMGKTVAVMATGVDSIYPYQHRALSDAIVNRGCIVSEYPLSSKPLRWRFPQRNRVITGLATATLVVEASLKSGSLVSARLAMEQNRPVLAVPHSLYHLGGAGCLQLLKDGAAMACSFEDVLAEVGVLLSWQCEQEAPKETSAGDPPVETALTRVENEKQQMMLTLIGYEPCSRDELLSRSMYDVPQTLALLTALELAGVIECRSGAYMRI